MGKASGWLCNFFTFRKPPKPDPQQKWNDRRGIVKEDGGNAVVLEADKHAIAVAAATAAVAEAAVAAAKAAQAVVKLTSSGRCDTSSFYGSGKRGGMMQRWAAVVIQSAFRGYLARRALKALKALVKLQALVRGHIVRKQTANQVRQMQALLRVQARARAGRGFLSESSRSSSRSSQHHPTDPKTPEKSEEVRSRSPCRNQPSALKRNTSKSVSRGTVGQGRPIQGADRVNNHDTNNRVWHPMMKTCPSNDHLSDKILEVDPGKPHPTFQKGNLFQALQGTWRVESRSQAAPSSNLSETVISTPIDYSCDLEEASFCTAENSPRFYSASSIGGGSSRGGPFTPTVSDSFHSYLSGSSENPSYMSYTESSKAKLRSLSAPKQRPQYERSGSSKRHSYHAVNDSKSGAQRLSTSYSSFTSKAYPGSGRLDKLGMPVIRSDSYSSLYGHI